MKKILFIVLMSIVFVDAYSQKLLIDDYGKNGRRTIATYFSYLSNGFADSEPVGISIMADIKKDSTLYYLGVRINGDSFKKGDVLLIKTYNDEVIELKQNIDGYKTKNTTFNNQVGAIMYGIGNYQVNFEDIENICARGFKKIRVQTASGYIDKEFNEKKNKKIIKEFTSMFETIKKEIEKGKNIYSDF